ncbi:hypothetical protein TWF730_002753 [Orbilia blumenaviensis]|uniref:Uncharacterized protein n=1 Tax=Orbilia blumenaviensis TaxID=1796055 RepID=A0AAV9U7Q1_9PEZI
MLLNPFKTRRVPQPFLIYLLTIVTGIASVYSQSTACTAEIRTVNSQEDLDALSDCVTLTGSLDFGRDIVNATIKGIQTIRGALRIPYGAKIQRLEAPELSFVGGIMHLNGALNLTRLYMPSLANVGSLRFEYLPRLRKLEFSSQIDSLGDDTAIQLVVWDTAIESLGDIIYRKIESVQIIENPNMNDINLPIQDITGIFVIRDNAPNTTVTLRNLQSAGYIHMGTYVEHINLPNLTSVETTVEIRSRDLKTLELPNLLSIGRERLSNDPPKASLEIIASSNLTDVSFPRLEWIMSYLRINGSETWTSLAGFPRLATVGDGVVVDGFFSNVDLPQFRAGDQDSTFWINSPALDCTRLLEQNMFTKGGWATNITCNGNTFDTSPEDNMGTGGDKKPLSGGAIAGVSVGVIAAVGAGMSVLFVCFRKKGYTHTLPWNRTEPPKIPELEDGEGGTHKGKTGTRRTAELEGQNTMRSELEGQKTVGPELEGSIPLAELEQPVPKRMPEHEALSVKPPEQI